MYLTPSLKYADIEEVYLALQMKSEMHPSPYYTWIEMERGSLMDLKQAFYDECGLRPFPNWSLPINNFRIVRKRKVGGFVVEVEVLDWHKVWEEY